jgi:intracellular multiplication protein IcmO
LRQGRSLNLSFILGFQEIPGIIARLGEKTGSLLGSANLIIAMRQQDAGKTRKWLEDTAGQTYVTQATAYQGSDDGGYREAREAAVRAVSRVDWQDLVSLLEGEAIFLMGGRRIYGRVFYAPIDDRGVKRLGRTIMLRGPDPGAVRSRLGVIDGIAAAIMKGSLTVGQDEQMTAVLAALLRGWNQAMRAGLDAASCARAALEAVGRVPGNQTERSAPPDGVPVTSVSPMMEAATAARHAGEASDKPPRPPVDAALLRGLQRVEQAGGIPVVAAREIALSILSERDEALARLERVEPPPITDAAFAGRLLELIGLLRAARPEAKREAA